MVARSAGRPTCSRTPARTCPHARVTRPVAPERPGYVDARRRPRRRPRRHRPGRQPPARGRPDRLRRRAVSQVAADRDRRSARTARWRSSTPAATSSADEAATALLAAVHGRAGAARRAPRAAGARMSLALAELHVHLEGTAPPALIQQLADRNGLKVPEGVFAAPDRFQLGRLPRLPAHLRPRGERHPHRSRTTATSPTST